MHEFIWVLAIIVAFTGGIFVLLTLVDAMFWEQGDPGTRLSAAFSRSATIFWARLQVMIGFAGVVAEIATPQLMEPLRQVVSPQVWVYFLIAQGVITEILRRRTLP